MKNSETPPIEFISIEASDNSIIVNSSKDLP